MVVSNLQNTCRRDGRDLGTTMTIRIQRILFACAMSALFAAGVAGPVGTLTNNLGSLFDWVATIALVAGVAIWWLLSLQTGTTRNARRPGRWMVFLASVGIMLIVLHWLPTRSWPLWISALSKTFPLILAFVLWQRWRE
jgi:hypothetical protein